jgi:hypothetical protein
VAVGRRWLGDIPRLSGRSWEDVAPQLEIWLKRIWDSESDGIPAGFEENVPEAVEAGSDGDMGEETTGWAASDHEHPVVTGAPGGLANTNVEGSATAIPRLDHQHKRDVRVKHGGVDFATRNALDFVDGLLTWSLTDDSGNDEVDVDVSAGAGLIKPVGLIVDGRGDVITPGLKGYGLILYSGTITSWSILSDIPGSIVIDVWKDSWVNFPPTVADTIAGSEKPTLSSQQINRDLALTTWSTDVASGDIIAFKVDSVSTVTKVQLVLGVSPS